MDIKSVTRQGKEVLDQFEIGITNFCGSDIRVLRNVAVSSDLISLDAILQYHGIIVAVVQIVHNIEFLKYTRRDIAKILKRAQVQIGIVITLDGDYYLRKITHKESVKTTIEKIAKEVQSIYKDIKDNLDPAFVRNKLLSIYDKTTEFDRKKELRPLFEKACKKLIVKEGRVTMREGDEITFMLSLLGDPTIGNEKICRYTSLSSLFYIVDSGKHAMCSPVSMNDRHECDYADKFMPWNVDRVRGSVEIENDNSCFLLSCSSIEESDSLTMWRLYGDGAKGICIEYDVEYNKVDNEQYFLARVSYGQKDRNTGKISHPELEFLSELQAEAIDIGWYFSLTMWFIWKFFFKAWEYKEEHEIRLIYLPDITEDEQLGRIKWYKDQANGIFNRMVLIPIEIGKRKDFPLRISKIILGPQSPESRKNAEQIFYMIEEKSIDTTGTFQVVQSSIKNYR